ncbi:MAG TPA: hypothetical protein VGN34_25420 [Ktedonobacteraceae bacterium]
MPTDPTPPSHHSFLYRNDKKNETHTQHQEPRQIRSRLALKTSSARGSLLRGLAVLLVLLGIGTVLAVQHVQARAAAPLPGQQLWKQGVSSWLFGTMMPVGAGPAAIPTPILPLLPPPKLLALR